MDKAKDIKFASYPGDRPMTEAELEYERQIADEFHKARQ